MVTFQWTQEDMMAILTGRKPLKDCSETCVLCGNMCHWIEPPLVLKACRKGHSMHWPCAREWLSGSNTGTGCPECE